jgi:uncharacterized membrane protein SpoIIM required for sporulation
VSREVFERKYASRWRDLEGLLLALGARKTGPGPDVARMPALYRQVCHHLALARHRQYGGDLERHLERLALSGHQALYGRRALPRPAASRPGFLGMVREERRLVGLALLLLFAPAIAAAVASLLYPDVAGVLVEPKTLDSMARQFAPEGSLKAGRPVDNDVLMFGFYIYNNIGVAFRTFAGGVLFGIGTVFFLVQNGILMGTIAGAIHEMGFEKGFYSFVIGHGAFELTAIALSGAAGLRIGLGVLTPGRLTRARSLFLAARRSVTILYGAAAMLVIAAFLEAFWSSASDVPPAVKLWVGALLWLLVAGVLAGGGRAPRKEA